LDVRAELPNTSCDATTVIERAVGMSSKRFDSWAARLSEGFVIEEEHVPEEPVDVDEIEGLLDEMDGELEVSEDDSERETTTDAPPPSKRATGDAALDDFLKGIG
jgi:hypothetical protein